MPAIQGGEPFLLPPLILHPFADAKEQARVLASSKAMLIQNGLAQGDQQTPEDLENTILDGRYCEMKMLIRLGRDLLHWIDQCVEVVNRDKQRFPEEVKRQSFMRMLVDDTPAGVLDKLQCWGVVEHRNLFSRALGLNMMFVAAPRRKILADDFVSNYFRYAERLYMVALQQETSPICGANDFRFELYSANEYSQMLEQQWGM